MNPHDVLEAFDLKDGYIITPFGKGLINHTWKVTAPKGEYILQKVNHHVFTQPEDIAHNCRLIADYLKKHHPEYFFVAPVTSHDGHDLVHRKEGYYRLFPFVKGSHAKEVAETPEQAFEAARQFGRFTRLLSGLDIRQLKITIPAFHDLALRYEQFLSALKKRNSLRIRQAQKLIDQVLFYAEIAHQYQLMKSNPAFKLRVTHHDTKISNVLFDSRDKGICVIDLDTVMPGYFISDVGDMLRTYLSPVSEEEGDLEKIHVREEFCKAVVEGYYSEMKGELTEMEKQHFFYAGKFMIYMQALRFLTDYLNDDVYYGAKYEGHNLVRATNQMVLLEQFVTRQDVIEKLLL